MRNPSQELAGAGRSTAAAGGGTSKTPTPTPTPCCSKVGIKRGPWTPEEDEILASYIKREGEGQWRTLPKRAGLVRCGKSCRLRWMNYLRPHLKRGHISPDEEDLILRLHRLLGNRWSLIAGRIPGRTDNEIKNYWNTHLSKKLISQGLDPRTHKPLVNYNLIANPNASSSFSDHNNDNHHHVRSDVAPNPNPISPTKPSPPPPPPMIINQEASTTSQNNHNNSGIPMAGYSSSSHGIDSNKEEDQQVLVRQDMYNYNDEIFSSFLDSLIMNEDVFQQPQQANDTNDNQLLQVQGQYMMMQPIAYDQSDSYRFGHGSVWESDRFHP